MVRKNKYYWKHSIVYLWYWHYLMHMFYITDVKELSKGDSTNIKNSNHIIQLYDDITFFSLSNLTRNEFDIWTKKFERFVYHRKHKTMQSQNYVALKLLHYIHIAKYLFLFYPFVSQILIARKTKTI